MAIPNPALFFPMFAMFLLTAAVLLRMGYLRVRAIKSGQIKLNYFAIYDQNNGPEKMIQAERHFVNLFEVPVLFYAVCILGILFSQGTIFVALAWIYIAARVVHAAIHMGSNNILWRMQSYLFGWLVLGAMWVSLAIQLLSTYISLEILT